MDIKLRDIALSDIEQVRVWRNSEEVSKYMYTSDKISKEQQITWFNKVKDDASVKYWIIEYDGKDLGLASLTNIDKTLNSCYWAFYLGDSSVRRAGIGGKVEYNVLSYVFDNVGLNKLRCEVFTFNQQVIKMHEKYGFRREAYYREHCEKNNELIDVVGLAMLNSEWKVQKDIIYDKVYNRD